MADTIPTPAPVVPEAVWNEDLIFSALADPVRRKLLFALARGGPQPASKLKTVAGRQLDATLKQLVTLREAGLLVTTPDPQDGRRMLYALASAVQLAKTETGVVLDFGFCRLRPA
jgi:DNA-binding transcriptional ArsR family regulator